MSTGVWDGPSNSGAPGRREGRGGKEEARIICVCLCVIQTQNKNVAMQIRASSLLFVSFGEHVHTHAREETQGHASAHAGSQAVK